MFSFKDGRPLAKIVGGELDGEIIYLKNEQDEQKPCCKRCSKKCEKRPCCGGCRMCYEDEDDDLGDYIEIEDGKLIPIPKIHERSVDYIAGPSGSGKSTHAAILMKAFKRIFPDKDIYIFSRTDAKNDPAFSSIRPIQIKIDDSIVENPIDVTKELTGGCLILFDDCNTVQDDKQKKAVDKLMADIMEVGRKLGIWIIITNHLVIPNEKKIARTILNEAQSLTVFPKSGAAQQIMYCLKNYYGLNTKQIKNILSLPSRWVTVHKNYPMCVVHDKGAFIL
jgi:hypothetical protein